MIEPADLATTIETDRLALEPLLKEHAEELFPVLSDLSLYEFTQEQPPSSLANLQERYRFLEARRSPNKTQLWLNWLIRERATLQAIGYVQATVTSDSADIAWVVGVDWQDRGYATEAARAAVELLRAQGICRFKANIHDTHMASRRVAAKLGLLETNVQVKGETIWVDTG